MKFKVLENLIVKIERNGEMNNLSKLREMWKMLQTCDIERMSDLREAFQEVAWLLLNSEEWETLVEEIH